MHSPFTFYVCADEEAEEPLSVSGEQFKAEALEKALSGFVDSDVGLAVEIVFADSEEIRRLNREQRNVDAVTDVLSFPSLDGIFQKPLRKEEHPYDVDENGNLFLGSVVICRERAQEQACEYGHSYERELHYLLVHGVLHCLGYDHMDDSEKKAMREAEEQILVGIGVTRDA